MRAELRQPQIAGFLHFRHYIRDITTLATEDISSDYTLAADYATPILIPVIDFHAFRLLLPTFSRHYADDASDAIISDCCHDAGFQLSPIRACRCCAITLPATLRHSQHINSRSRGGKRGRKERRV